MTHWQLVILSSLLGFHKYYFKKANKQTKGQLNTALLQDQQLLYCLHISKFLSEPKGTHNI